MEKQTVVRAQEVRDELVAIERLRGALSGRAIDQNGSIAATLPLIQKATNYLNLSALDADAVCVSIRAEIKKLIGYRTRTLERLLTEPLATDDSLQSADLEGRR
jgi:hypothetical protein